MLQLILQLICDSVVKTGVKQRILTPKSSVYLLRDITQGQSYSCPYTICFISNGVGKCFAKGTKVLKF
ncbi:unnamed protein product [Rhizophagus irregularis]|nr:unnamed protein product [Rhizophagus irregularis]